jgi:hypothetical protein
MIGVRYKSNTTSNINLDITSFYNLGLINNDTSKSFVLYNQNGLSLNSKFFTKSNSSNIVTKPITSNLDYLPLKVAHDKLSPYELNDIFNFNLRLTLNQILEKSLLIYNDLFDFIITRYAINLDLLYFYLSSINFMSLINKPR